MSNTSDARRKIDPAFRGRGGVATWSPYVADCSPAARRTATASGVLAAATWTLGAVTTAATAPSDAALVATASQGCHNLGLS